MDKKENDGTKNSESQNLAVQRLPEPVVYLNDLIIEEKGEGSRKLLYKLVCLELENMTNTCSQLKVYNELVFEKLEVAAGMLGELIHTATTGGSASLPISADERGDYFEKELRLFKRYITKMKLPIPSKLDAKDLEKQLKELNKSATKNVEQIAADALQKQVPRLHRDQTFENSPAFRDFEVQYNALSHNLKLCLLCFSVFPVRAIIKKRLMVYWWMAEGFIEQKGDTENTKDSEQLGADYFDELVRKGFIKPYHNKRRLEVKTVKMPPFIRSAVISIAARAKFFDFNSSGRPQAYCPYSFRSALLNDQRGLESNFEFEKLHVVFNVSENILDIWPEWIQRMKNAVVLYLGRWQSIGNHHIQVYEPKFLVQKNFLEDLGDMKHLKFLSLQGISGIVVLPDQVTKLGYLTILDLRACYNLEKIPNNIGLLKSLTHLDLSECYLLEQIPKGLSKLKNLLVLKGFVVVATSKSSCSLEDLSRLPKLRKLSIFTGLEEFPVADDLKAFQQLKKLTNLKIVWGGGVKKEDSNQIQNEPAVDEKSENDEEPSRELQKPTLGNEDNRGSTDPAAPKNEPEHALAPTTEPDAVQAPEGDNRKVPQDETTPSSKRSTLRDMAKLPKLRDVKQTFCFGEATSPETDTKIAASGAMDSASPVLVPQLPSTPESKVVPAPAGDMKKVSNSKMSKTNSSYKSAVLEGSSKPSKQKKWWNLSDNGESHHLPAKLQKLELQCFPNTKAPKWLNPTKLENLKRLYIRGGQLSDLGGNTGEWNGKVNPWKVEILRLKYLTGLAMHWREVDKLFPELIFLEKVNCPKLTFFPCDEAGVWINTEKTPKH